MVNSHRTQSVQFSCSVVSDPLRSHGLQHSRPPCPSPSPRAYSNSCPSSRRGHPTSSSSVALFSSHFQSFPASGSLPISQLFASGGQSIGVSASASALVFPMNTQDWSPLGWTGWSSCRPRDYQESTPTPQFKIIHSLTLRAFFIKVQLSHPYMTTGKTTALTKWTFVD